jgi:hypothetical protein
MSNFYLDFNVGEGNVKLDAKIIPYITTLNIQLTFGSNCPDLLNIPDLSQFINLEKLTYTITYMNYKITDKSDSNLYFWQENPCELIGKRINVKWNKERIYSGRVISYDPKNQVHIVNYDDGEIKTYDMCRKIFSLENKPTEWFQPSMIITRSRCRNGTENKLLYMNDNPLITSVLNEKIILDLNKCVKLKSIKLINAGKHTIDNLDLTKCVNLKEFYFENNIIDRIHEQYEHLQYLNLSKLDLTKCLDLKNFKYKVFVITTLYDEGPYNKILPNLSNNIKINLPKIEIIKSHKYDTFFLDYAYSVALPFNIQDHLELFPRNLTEFSQEGIERLHQRVKHAEEENRLLKIKDDENKKILQQHESLLSLIEAKFNKLEEENKELRKIIDELRPIKSSYM